MPEPVANVEPNEGGSEIETLRKTVSELTQKAATRKARIEALEANTATLQAKATEAETRIRQLTVDAPVNDLMNDLSKVPNVLRRELETEYRFDLDDKGSLSLIDLKTGKPAVDAKGAVVPLNREGVMNFLLSTKDGEKKTLFNSILIASKATGSGGSTTQHTRTASTRPQFGLGMKL